MERFWWAAGICPGQTKTPQMTSGKRQLCCFQETHSQQTKPAGDLSFSFGEAIYCFRQTGFHKICGNCMPLRPLPFVKLG